MNKCNKIFTIILFVSFAFTFFHSELNFLAHFDSDQHQHELHDYCKIVKTAKVEKVSVRLLKGLVNYSSPLNYNDFQISTDYENFFRTEEFPFYKKFQNIPHYLANQIFLI